ncbi:uncharacterized protein [Chironomus tepperi]
MMSSIDVIVAQFKVVKMESLRSLTSHDQQQQHHHQHHHHRTASVMHEKGKLTKDSNVTVIQVLPSERANRRIDKVIKRRIDPTMASDFKLLTPRESTDAKVMKLHIINVRTGKIQDAIMLTTGNNDVSDDSKSNHKASDRGNKKIIRIQPLDSIKPEKTLNEINISKKYPLKPYKLRNKFTSAKCKCEDTARMWNCKKIQISIAQCKSNQFMCCS